MERTVTIGCTAAIIATMVGCTWWHERQVERAIPSYPVYNDALVEIHHRLVNIDKDLSELESIEGQLHTIDKSVQELAMHELLRR